MARVDVESEIVIRRPAAEVAAFAGDPRNAPRWYATISSVIWRTPPPLGLGSELDFVARFLGRELRYTYAITAWEPGSRLVMQTAQGPFPMRTTYTWTSVHGGTQMTLRNDGEPSGFAAIGAGVIAAAIRRANRQDLQNLKRVLESQGSGQG